MNAAVMKTSTADEVYMMTDGASEDIRFVYRVYVRIQRPNVWESFVRSIKRRKLQMAISDACRKVETLNSALDTIIKDVVIRCEEIPEPKRRNHPFSYIAEMISGSLYGIDQMRQSPDQPEGLDRLYRLACQSRNKSLKIASLLKQMEPPREIFDSQFDRGSLLLLSQQTTRALDAQIKH
ncbi:hypothetical protein S7S_07055 [Isoalcanivorax pacificus W11-5]|uniref:Uncharacterized protein n=1 Tax=Isoalcanivorax pacificus W11-5 TaxID=391936 RepID=A0A0B4XNE5_9GAMM|nr:hypothetical protein [Isoalcanivorax pacificus]AJD47827.1 hypothetical protein S7S_07055 [Isoalcanivorax pacificus W11-5]